MTAVRFPSYWVLLLFETGQEPLIMNLQYHFLIAMPTLQDPIFRRSVVYICEYNDDGAMGIIINKPLDNLPNRGNRKTESHQTLEIRLSVWINRSCGKAHW